MAMPTEIFSEKPRGEKRASEYLNMLLHNYIKLHFWAIFQNRRCISPLKIAHSPSAYIYITCKHCSSSIHENHIKGTYLWSCTYSKCFENHVHHPLRGEHISTDYSCCIRWIQHAAFGYDDFHRFQAALCKTKAKRWLGFGRTRNSETSLKSNTCIGIQLRGFLLLFAVSTLTETIQHVDKYVQKLPVMFTTDLSVQIKFLSVQILSNAFGICILGPSLACLMLNLVALRITWKLIR